MQMQYYFSEINLPKTAKQLTCSWWQIKYIEIDLEVFSYFVYSKKTRLIIALGEGRCWISQPTHRPSLPALNRFRVEKLPETP